MWLDILLGVLIAAAVALAMGKMVRDRRRGKGCSCGCGGCARSDCPGHKAN